MIFFNDFLNIMCQNLNIELWDMMRNFSSDDDDENGYLNVRMSFFGNVLWLKEYFERDGYGVIKKYTIFIIHGEEC